MGLTQSQHTPAQVPTSERSESGPIILVYCSQLKKEAVEMLILFTAPLAKSRAVYPTADQD